VESMCSELFRGLGPSGSFRVLDSSVSSPELACSVRSQALRYPESVPRYQVSARPCLVSGQRCLASVPTFPAVVVPVFVMELMLVR
jgi:hypothetical protein